MNNLKIALCQSDIVWEDAQATLSALEQPVERFCSSRRPDVLVLPETFSAGFSNNPEVSEKGDGISACWLRMMASRTGVAFVASIPTLEDEKRYNRLYFVCPDGTEYHYDKRHLFNYGGEGKTYTPGQKQCIVDYKGWHICLNVCYDLRFPVWTRNVACGYDVLVYIANWPDIRVKAAQILIHARAVENCCYALFCNRVGKDPACNYDGHSAIINFFGENIALRRKVSGVTFLESELDAFALAHYRQKFPAAADQDKFAIQI